MSVRRNARRGFLRRAGATLITGLLPADLSVGAAADDSGPDTAHNGLKLFLCGDVMTGRGIDQIQQHPSRRELHESYITDARGYVALAERRHGSVPAPVPPAYIWGDALDALAHRQPDARIVNLETAVTVSDAWWRGKGIHYRMHPHNIACLTAAGVDVCALANNHVLDFGYPGLAETLRVLERAGIKPAGAGPDREAAAAPVSLAIPGKGRVRVFALGARSSGIPRWWRAEARRAGVNLTDLSPSAADALTGRIAGLRRPGDVVVVSIHWGANWGYDVPDEQRAFAHRLIDSGTVDIIHGHSSHHPKGIEVYRGRLILYGCGDFINDYEGIEGYREYRGELGAMYFPLLDGAGRLIRLQLVPTRLYRLQVRYAEPEESDWLRTRLDRESRKFCSAVQQGDSHTLQLVF